MSGRSLCWCCLFFTWISLSLGTRLYPCGADGYRDVKENTIITFHCDQYTGVVTWNYLAPASVFGPTPIATCNDTSCGPSSLWTVTYISAGNSSVTTTLPAHTSRIQAGGQYQCEGQKCELHIIVPAKVSQPTTTMTRQDSGYTLSVSADVTQVYSSRGLYSCIGQLGSSRQTTQPDLTPPASDVSNTANRTGKCDVTMPLPVTSGTYPCSVTVTPGNTQRSCGSITITRPPPPTISCPSDFIAENTPFTCTCSTSDMGQPGGRLRWYTGTGSDVNTEVISGNYDTNTLAMTRTVTRSDNFRKFRCVNNWTVNVTAQSDCIARVAWGPDTVSIQGNTAFYTDTTQSQTMTLACLANGVSPFSRLTYNWDKLCDDKQRSACTFKPGPGDDNTVIRCTVTNGNNNNRHRYNTVTLDIKYPPSSAPQISGYSGGVLYEGDHLTLTCTVTGGDPVVTSVTLTCPGRHEQNPTSGQSSTLEISSLSASDHNLTCVCRGQWARQYYYTLTDSRTLTVYYQPTDTTLTVNDKTSVTVNETETVTLKCQSWGRPTPQLQLLQRNSQLAQEKGGQLSLSAEMTRLSHNVKTQCNNTGTLTCRAGNGVGSDQPISVQLYVNCKPRKTTAVLVPPKLNFINKPVSAAFSLEAFPLPDRFTFQYLSSTQSSNTGQPMSDNKIELTAVCTNTHADYAVSCNVSVVSARDLTAEGFYTFTAANAFGQEQFVFQVTVNDSPTASSPADFGVGAAVGVTLAVVVVVVVVIVFVIVVLLWRRHWILPCAAADGGGQRSRDSRKERGEGTQSASSTAGVYELMEDGSPRQATDNQPPSVYTSLQTSDIGLRSVYSTLTPYETVGADLHQNPVYENSEEEKRAVYVNLPDKP